VFTVRYGIFDAIRINFMFFRDLNKPDSPAAQLYILVQPPLVGPCTVFKCASKENLGSTVHVLLRKQG
jgi:hypothetical protein